MVNLYDYSDYRLYLADKIQERKEKKKTFSYRWFSQKAGFTSPNVLNLVVKGKRHLSGDSVEKVIEIFALTKDEAAFFRNLVSLNKAKTPSERQYYAQLLVRSRPFQKAHPLSKEQFDYYSQWFNIPVREVLTLAGKPKRADEIGERLLPALSGADVADSLELMEKLGLVRKSGEGFVPTQTTLATGHRVANYGVVAFHKKMIGLAAESLDRFPGVEREISSVTIGLSDENFQKVKTLIQEFRTRLLAISEEDPARERIYQANFQLFPLSKKESS